MPGVGTHPDLPTTFVHFTGRPRSSGDAPPDFANGTPEERMVRILIEGQLRATKVFGASHPVLCFTEPSEIARRVMLRDGVTQRGPYAPWGLIFDRARLIAAEATPVLHMSAQEMRLTADLPVRSRNRRIRYEPGRSDWLHEREWRICFGPEDEPSLHLTPDLLVGVIVGEQGWMPPPVVTVIKDYTENKIIEIPRASGRPVRVRAQLRVQQTNFRYSAAADQLVRWWWNGEDIVEDGVFDVQTQMSPDGSSIVSSTKTRISY